jgi:hypothetical protein
MVLHGECFVFTYCHANGDNKAEGWAHDLAPARIVFPRLCQRAAWGTMKAEKLTFRIGYRGGWGCSPCSQGGGN